MLNEILSEEIGRSDDEIAAQKLKFEVQNVDIVHSLLYLWNVFWDAGSKKSMAKKSVEIANYAQDSNFPIDTKFKSLSLLL